MVEPSPAATLVPPTQCQIIRMPVEILDAIFAEVQVWETLIALTRTCWRFREVLEPCTHRSVIIRSAGGLSSFHHALQAKPSGAELVRSFAIKRGERAKHSSATADELSDFCLIPSLARLENLHLESFFMDQAEFNAILLRAAQGELLRSLKTCTLNIQHPSFSTIGGHVFETILTHPTLERLTIHLFDHGLRPHTNPPTALRRLELRDSRLSPAGLRNLTIAGAAWLLLPPRLEELETSGWGEAAGGFVDEPLLHALRRIDLPSRGGCGEVSMAFRTACEVNGIVASQSDVLEVT
ncbi:hypothetical protein SLS56_010665 [Neofusicoccum ribis]|uniref:F-box domain-containing protein n=1 Tax=Neofusicoccum ribis TaxID=45134 RepID=A0ABR3SER3_9PEZI